MELPHSDISTEVKILMQHFLMDIKNCTSIIWKKTLIELTYCIVYLKSLYHNRFSQHESNSGAFTVVNKLLKVVRLDLSSVSSSYLSVNSQRYHPPWLILGHLTKISAQG